MERGYIKIEENKKDLFTVDIKLVNGTLWLTNFEIADLFGCFTGKIDAAIKSIFKSKLLNETDVTYIHCYKEKKDIKKEIIYYNLDVLMFVNYRIETLKSKIFREFIKNVLQKHLNNREKLNSFMPMYFFNPSLN